MKPYLTTRDYACSKEVFDLLMEEERGLLVTHPRPQVLDPYYEGQDYISHTDGSSGFFDKVYQIIKRYSIRSKLRLLKPYLAPGAAVLDIGAGTGSFVLAARKEGWDTIGVEPSKKARDHARDKGVLLKESLDELSRERYSLITLWHVLEHLPDLESQIRKIIAILEKEGTIVLAVPNYKSWDARHYKQYWAAYDVPRHLWHFSGESISKIFNPFGFRIVARKPMIFDSFYIAILSEKYKNGRGNPFKAFFTGLYSNISAWSTKEYSSVIYILKPI